MLKLSRYYVFRNCKSWKNFIYWRCFFSTTGSEGSFQILNNHAPIVSTLKKGEIKLRGSFDNDSAENLNVQNNKEASLEIQSGVIEMKKNKLIILVD